MKSSRNRATAMLVLCATQVMVILDGSIVTVALPAIRDDLGFTASGLSWVVNGFFVAFAGLLLFSGRLGDLVGPRRVFVAGLMVFTLSSIWCAAAWHPGMLVAGRVAQGVGGALSSAVVLGMIARLYPDEAERGRAFAVFAFVGSAGASLGVIAGGLLTELVSWHWVFWVNVPIGAAATLLALRALEPDGRATTRGIDIAGAVLATAGLMVGVFAVSQVPQVGWATWTTGGLVVVAALLLTGFVLRQRNAAIPLVPPALFTGRRFTLANLVLLTMTMAGMSFQFLTALYLQDVLAFRPLRAGLSFLAVTVSIAVSSLLLSGRLAGRFGIERVLVGGLVLFTSGMLLLTRIPADGSFLVDIAPAMVLMGTGFGLAMPQVTVLAMRDAPAELVGSASGVVNTTQQVGGTVGISIVSSVAASVTASLLATGTDGVAADASGLRAGYGVAALALVTGTVVAVSLAITRARPPAAPEPVDSRQVIAPSSCGDDPGTNRS